MLSSLNTKRYLKDYCSSKWVYKMKTKIKAIFCIKAKKYKACTCLMMFNGP